MTIMNNILKTNFKLIRGKLLGVEILKFYMYLFTYKQSLIAVLLLKKFFIGFLQAHLYAKT